MTRHYVPNGAKGKLKQACAPRSEIYRVPNAGRRIKGLVPTIESTSEISFVKGTYLQVPVAPFMKQFTDNTSQAPFQAGRGSNTTSLSGDESTLILAPKSAADELVGLSTACFHFYRKRNRDMGNTNLDTWGHLDISIYAGNTAGDLAGMDLIHNFILTEQVLARKSRSIIEFRIVLAEVLNGVQGSLKPVTFAYTSSSDITGIKVIIKGSDSDQFKNVAYLPSQLDMKELASWKRDIL